MTASKDKSKTVIKGGVQLTPEELNILNQALDELMAEVSEDHLPFLGSEGQRKGLLHGSWHDLGKAMRQPRTCIYPGCADQSIPRSHTIQKAAPLSFIAEDSHVVAPKMNSRGYSIARVGLNDASTFPGFCQKHEAIFHEFESTGEIKTGRDIVLQVFRTICREIAVKQIQIAQVRKLRETHDRLISSKAMDMLKRRLGDDFVKKHGLRSLSFDRVSKGQIGMMEAEMELGKALKVLETEFLPASALELDGREDSLYHVSITVQQPLPVCLAGMANFWIDDHGKRLSIRTILNVLPSPQQTLIVATTLATHERYLETYIKQMLEMNGALIMGETWMVRGPDHWFMTPSEWEAIPESRQVKILADMLDESASISGAYQTPVLVSVREQLLTLPEA
jgi:hypothetical protein